MDANPLDAPPPSMEELERTSKVTNLHGDDAQRKILEGEQQNG